MERVRPPARSPKASLFDETEGAVKTTKSGVESLRKLGRCAWV